MFIKKLMPFFNAESGSGSGSGYMVDPEHLQNVFTSESDPGLPPVEEEVVEPEVDSEEIPTEETPVTPAEKHRIKWNGEEREMSYEELVAAAQQGYDYTQKSQSLAEQRKQLDEQYQVERELNELFSQHPELANNFGRMVQEFFGQQGQPQGQNPQGTAPQVDITANPMFQQIQQQNQAMQQQLEQLMETQQQAQIQKEWNELYAKYPDSKDMTNDLANFADQHNINLDMAYRLMNFDKVQQRAKEQLAANATKKAVARTQTPANATGGQAPKSSAPKGYGDILAAIQADGIQL